MFSKVVISSLLLAASVNGVMGIQYKREPGWFQRDLQSQEILREVGEPAIRHDVPLVSSHLARDPVSAAVAPIASGSGSETKRPTEHRSSKKPRMVRAKRQHASRDNAGDPNALSSSVGGDSSSALPTPTDSGVAIASDSSTPTPTGSSAATPTDPGAATPSASSDGASASSSAAAPTDPSTATPSSSLPIPSADPSLSASNISGATPSVAPVSSSDASNPSASVASSSSVAPSVSPTTPPDALDQLIGSLFNGLPQGVKDGLSALATAQLASSTGSPQATPSASSSAPTDGSSASASSSTPAPDASLLAVSSSPLPSSTPTDGGSSVVLSTPTDSPSSSASDSAVVPSSTPDASINTDGNAQFVTQRAYPPPIRRSAVPSASGSVYPSVNAATGNQLVFSTSTLTGLGVVMASMFLGAVVAL